MNTLTSARSLAQLVGGACGQGEAAPTRIVRVTRLVLLAPSKKAPERAQVAERMPQEQFQVQEQCLSSRGRFQLTQVCDWGVESGDIRLDNRFAGISKPKNADADALRLQHQHLRQDECLGQARETPEQVGNIDVRGARGAVGDGAHRRPAIAALPSSRTALNWRISSAPSARGLIPRVVASCLAIFKQV